jgi:hypothetical protein
MSCRKPEGLSGIFAASGKIADKRNALSAMTTDGAAAFAIFAAPAITQ